MRSLSLIVLVFAASLPTYWPMSAARAQSSVASQPTTGPASEPTSRPTSRPFGIGPSFDPTSRPAGSSEDRLGWFRKAKFGMFIHWGPYAVLEGRWKNLKDEAEWIMLKGKISSADYMEVVRKFTPTKFDAKEWSKVAHDAGMRYMVITAKHHDGFSMYDSKLTGYDIVDATPYGKDPMKSLSRACREAGMTFCFYYSLPDWHHPEFPARYSQEGFHGDPNSQADISKYAAFMQGQLRELLTNYGPIGILWFDGGGSFKNANRSQLLDAQKTLAMIRELQPDCLLNDRFGGADYATSEQKIPGGAGTFEVCMTLNDHWGYCGTDNNWKSATDVVRMLADIAGKNGNLLLNVGPKADGTIPEQSVAILREVGAWMNTNGDSIYDTCNVPVQKEIAWGALTQKKGKLFCHVLTWPANGEISIPNLTANVASATLLADPARKIAVTQDDAGTKLKIAGACPDAKDAVIALAIDGDLFPLSLRQIVQSPNGDIQMDIRDASLHGATFRYRAGRRGMTGYLGDWTEAGDWLEWTVLVDKPGRFTPIVRVSSPAGGQKLTVVAGDQKAAVAMPAAGNYSTFGDVSLPSINLKKGVNRIELHPVAAGWAPLNFQAMTLKVAPAGVSVNFDNCAPGPFSDEMSSKVFRPVGWSQLEGRSQIVPAPGKAAGDLCVAVSYPAGGFGPHQTGGQFVVNLQPAEEYCLDYYVMFKEGFDFKNGGKLPGLTSGGGDASGGTMEVGKNWSARYMWNRGGAVTVYLYHPGRRGQWGDGIRLPNCKFVPGQWTRLTQHIRLNTGRNSDGVLQVWFDGKLVIDRNDICYRYDDAGPIDSLYFSTFHGGGSEEYAPVVDCVAYFDKFRVVQAAGIDFGGATTQPVETTQPASRPIATTQPVAATIGS